MTYAVATDGASRRRLPDSPPFNLAPPPVASQSMIAPGVVHQARPSAPIRAGARFDEI